MTFVAELEPIPLWKHFDKILTIPRGSKNEDQMRRTLLAAADWAGLSHQVDDVGNVVVQKPGTAGHEGASVTVLQSHLDMVNEKNADHQHDFTRATRSCRCRRETISRLMGRHSARTTGSASPRCSRSWGPPIWCTVRSSFLFTIDEETGLTGAAELDSSLLEGRQLINPRFGRRGHPLCRMRRGWRQPADGSR